jgi:hypothetical protein
MLRTMRPVSPTTVSETESKSGAGHDASFSPGFKEA